MILYFNVIPLDLARKHYAYSELRHFVGAFGEVIFRILRALVLRSLTRAVRLTILSIFELFIRIARPPERNRRLEADLGIQPSWRQTPATIDRAISPLGAHLLSPTGTISNGSRSRSIM
jgi:hypothetical protein